MRIGANVAPGQILAVTALVEHAPFVRAVARAGYAAGARCVDVNYVDSHVRKAFIEGAPEELLEWSPPWKVTRQQYLGDERGAEVSISGDPEPQPARGRRRRPRGPRDAARTDGAQRADDARRAADQLDERSLPERRLGRGHLRRARRRPALGGGRRSPFDSTSRTPSPRGARTSTCSGASGSLNGRSFDALRFHGPGTDLTIGLSPLSLDSRQSFQTSWGQSTCRTCRPRRCSSRPTAPNRRHRALDDAARAAGHARDAPRASVRGRARSST